MPSKLDLAKAQVDRWYETELPDNLPEKARPAYRDYIIKKYNSTFPTLQEDLIERMGELR